MRNLPEDLGTLAASRDDIDSWIVLGCLLLITLTSSLTKFGLDASGAGSLSSQIFWGSAYAISFWRLMILRDRAGRLVKRTWPMVLFLALALVSYFWSVEPGTTLRNAIEMIGMTATCYYIVVRFTLREFLELAVKYFVGVSLVSAVLIFLWPSHGRSSYGVVGWSGLFSEKNGFGAAMALSILTYGVAAAIAKGGRRLRMLLCLLMGTILLVGSQSLTSLLVLFATGMLVIATVLCSSRRYGKMARLIVIVVALFGAVGIALIRPDATSVLGTFGKSEDISGRADFWPGITRAIGDRPLLGFGYNAFFSSVPTQEEYLKPLLGYSWWYPFHAHNSYYQMTLSVGFVGVAIFACALIQALFMSLVHIVRDHDVAAAWPLAMLGFVLLGSFTETYFGLPNFIASLFFLIGLLYPFRETIAVERGSVRRTVARRNVASSAA